MNHNKQRLSETVPDYRELQALGLSVFPSYPDRPKWNPQGHNHSKVYSDDAWDDPRVTPRLALGRQANGLWLAAIDFDGHDPWQQPDKAATTFEAAIGPELAEHLPKYRSFTGTGWHYPFFSPFLIEKQEHHFGGKPAGEVLCERCAAPAPARDRFVRGSLDTIPVLSGDEVRIVLAALGCSTLKPHAFEALPEAPSRPTQVSPATENTSGESAIGLINSTHSLFELVSARRASSRGNYHCPCHDDKTPSLEVEPAKSAKMGDFVCRCWSPSCPLGDGRWYSYFDLFCVVRGVTDRQAIKYHNPRPAAPAVRNALTAAEQEAHRKADRERKQAERQLARREDLHELRVALHAAEFPHRRQARALALGELLLGEGTLRSQTTNCVLAKALGCDEKTVQRAFGDLKVAGLGTRTGGSNRRAGKTEFTPAVWAWTDPRGTDVPVEPVGENALLSGPEWTAPRGTDTPPFRPEVSPSYISAREEKKDSSAVSICPPPSAARLGEPWGDAFESDSEGAADDLLSSLAATHRREAALANGTAAIHAHGMAETRGEVLTKRERAMGAPRPIEEDGDSLPAERCVSGTDDPILLALLDGRDDVSVLIARVAPDACSSATLVNETVQPTSFVYGAGYVTGMIARLKALRAQREAGTNSCPTDNTRGGRQARDSAWLAA